MAILANVAAHFIHLNRRAASCGTSLRHIVAVVVPARIDMERAFRKHRGNIDAAAIGDESIIDRFSKLRFCFVDFPGHGRSLCVVDDGEWWSPAKQGKERVVQPRTVFPASVDHQSWITVTMAPLLQSSSMWSGNSALVGFALFAAGGWGLGPAVLWARATRASPWWVGPRTEPVVDEEVKW
ncbi:MAG TPA: hypothetical protein VEI74_12150 [Candidatus Methylomirabilis sp.]|nr:hypothetical protein [Candidatus Methylomirabilis sp.]